MFNSVFLAVNSVEAALCEKNAVCTGIVTAAILSPVRRGTQHPNTSPEDTVIEGDAVKTYEAALGVPAVCVCSLCRV